MCSDTNFAMRLQFIWLLLYYGTCSLFISTVSSQEPVLAICPGTCIALETECNTTLDGTHCGLGAKCCVDGMEGISEIGFDFSTLPTNEPRDWMENDMGTNHVATGTRDYEFEEFADPNADEFVDSGSNLPMTDCPGACIPKKHVSLCQYIITLDHLCSPDKSCCATKEAAAKIRRDYEISDIHIKQNFKASGKCPGKCVHPSLTMFCEKLMPSYSCPGESKCCNKQPTTTEVPELVQCTGQCLPQQSTYFCHAPFQLVPDAVGCKESTVCCMEVDQSMQEPELPAVREDYVAELGELAADESGQLYRMYDGEYKPLSIITSEESLNSNFAYVTDVDTEAGPTSIYRDEIGNYYQLSSVPEQEFQPRMASTESPAMQSDEDPEKPVVSMPDDSDDMEENMQDIALPDEGETISSNDPIPVGERTLIRPQCPGSCISSFLKFTCKRDSAAYDGFSCPGRLVCCANLADIEEHEDYLKSLSPYFKAAESVSQQHPECGITGFNGPISGTSVPVEKWCWQAAVINEQNQYVCGATIIDNSWVLTPAHCVTGSLRQEQSVYIRAGVSDLTSAAANSLGQTSKAQSVFVHPSHNSMSLDNDIALVKLKTPFELSRNVCAVCLPTSGEVNENDVCMVTGYGFLNRVGTLSLRLHEAEVPVVDDIDCIANITDALSSVFILPASSFCAGGDGIMESCQGDAGGPLVCERNGVYELVGMASWSLGCKQNYVPSIYVKISAFMDWINQIISASTFLKALS